MNFLVTGGASGLGEAITRRIAQGAGHRVYFTFNASEAGAKKIESDFSNAVSIKCDFKNEDEVAALREMMGKLDLDALINNAYAGTPIKSHFHKIAPGDFLTEFKDNVLPTLAITQEAIGGFRKKRQGRILTILTSFLIGTPPAGASIYVANKAYLEKLSKAWAVENAKFGITSNTVSPSFMLTNFTAGVDERVIERLREEHPLKELLSVGEVAETVFFLCTASRHLNGADIVLNAAAGLK